MFFDFLFLFLDIELVECFYVMEDIKIGDEIFFFFVFVCMFKDFCYLIGSLSWSFGYVILSID